MFDGPPDVALLASEASVPNVPDGLQALEERHAGLVSVLLNLPSYLAAGAAMLFVRGEFRAFDSFGTILGWSIVLAPVLTGSAVVHAIWAGRVSGVEKGSLRIVRATTALGILAVGFAVCVFLVMFAV